MIYSENILICIAIPLIIALLFTSSEVRRFLGAFLIGMITCLLSAYVSGFISFVRDVGAEYTAIYYSPIIEEIMKLLPLLFYISVFLPSFEKLFVVALGIGLGFATFENCCYILSSGASDVTYVLIRGMAVGVMHLVCALTLVLGLNAAIYFKVLSISCVMGSLALSMTFHGLYNLLVSQTGISSYLGYLLPILTAAVLYVPYRRMMSYYRKIESEKNKPQ